MARNKDLSYSQLASWLRCRHQWHLSYAQQIRPRVERPSINRGSAAHVAIAASLRNQPPQLAVQAWAEHISASVGGELFPEERHALASACAEGLAIAERTIAYLGLGEKWFTMAHPTTGELLVEHAFRFKAGGRWWRGFIDWVATDADGNAWLVDWKIRESFRAVAEEDFNPQMPTYVRALSHMGLHVVGSVSFQIKSMLPREPDLNKNGTMSRAAILTDWPTYEHALLKNNLAPSDYADMKDKLRDVEWFRLSRAYWPAPVTDAVWADFEQAAATMRSRARPRAMSPSNCTACRLRDYCMAELRGEDTEFLLKTQFVVGKQVQFTGLPTITEGEA